MNTFNLKKSYPSGTAKYFQRILLYLMVAVILSVLLLSLILYSVSLGFLKKEISSHNQTILNYISFSLDKSLGNIKRDALYAATVFDVDPENMLSLRNVSKRISSILYVNNFADQVFVHYTGKDTIISSEGLHSFDTFFQKEFPLVSADVPDFEAQIRQKNNFTIRSFDTSGGSYTCIMLSFPLYAPVSSGTVIFCVNNEHFREIIDTPIQGSSTALDESYSLSIQSRQAGPLFTSLEADDPGQQITSHIESDIFGDLSYVVSSTTRHLHAQKQLILIVIVAAGLVLIGIGLIFSFVASKQLYRPVGEVVQHLLQLPDSGSPLFSDDFDFINQKIHDLSDMTEDLRDNFESNRKLVDEMLVRNLFTGGPADPESAPLLKALCLPSFIILTVYHYCPVNRHDTTAVAAIGPLVENAARSSFVNGEELICRTSRNSIHSFSILLNFRDMSVFQSVLQRFTDQCNELGSRCHCNFVIGLSEFFSDPMDIVSAYDHSISALKNAPINTKLFISHFDADLPDLEFTHYTEKEKALINQAVLGNCDMVEQILLEIFTENINEQSTFHSTYRLYLRMISSLEELIHLSRMDDEMKSRYTKHLHELLEAGTMNNSEDHCTKLKNVFLGIARYQRTHSGEDPVIQQILDYIAENYDRDISLEDISSQFHLNYKYVSRYFKQQQGITFSTYLSQFRIQKAKQIIARDSNIKIKDLSHQVGFLSANTFIALFKKYEGITPGQYVELYRSQNPDQS